jgi:hypothetical protein
MGLGLIVQRLPREPWCEGRLIITPHSAFFTPEARDDTRLNAAETMQRRWSASDRRTLSHRRCSEGETDGGRHPSRSSAAPGFLNSPFTISGRRRLLSNEMKDDLSRARAAAVLEEEDALISAEHQALCADQDAEVGLGQRALDVGRPCRPTRRRHADSRVGLRQGRIKKRIREVQLLPSAREKVSRCTPQA